MSMYYPSGSQTIFLKLPVILKDVAIGTMQNQHKKMIPIEYGATVQDLPISYSRGPRTLGA